MRDPGLNTVTTLASLGEAAVPPPPPIDALSDPAVEDLAPAGRALWPRGAAWGTPDGVEADPDSVLARLTRVLLAPFAALYRRAYLLALESVPALADQTLPDWERDHGLPEPCVTGAQTRVERLAHLAAKVDATPVVTPGDFIRLAALYGFAVTIEEPAVFELGFSELGGEHTLGDWRQESYWIVRVAEAGVTFFRLGESELGSDPLFSYGEAATLLCILSRIAPAWSIPILATE